MATIYDLNEISVVDERREYKYLSLEHNPINVLMQVRRTKPSDEERARMMESFLAEGQLVPGIIAALTGRQAGMYLRRINSLWGSEYKLQNLKRVSIRGTPHYLILVAGHMRLETAEGLFALIGSGEITETGNFSGQYFAELRYGLSADEAVRIQVHENIRNHLHTADESYAAWFVWEWKRLEDPKYTKAALARTFGRSTSWVDDALLFAELPEEVQDLVLPGAEDTPKVSRSILLSAAWLAREMAKLGRPLSDVDILREVGEAIAMGYKPEQFDSRVRERVRHLSGDGGQQATIDLLEGLSAPEQPRRLIRRVAAPNQIRHALAAVGAVRELRNMRVRGAFGSESPWEPETSERHRSEYSTGSPVRLMGRLAEMLAEELSHWEALAAREGGRGRPLISENEEGTKNAAEALSQLKAIEDGSE